MTEAEACTAQRRTAANMHVFVRSLCMRTQEQAARTACCLALLHACLPSLLLLHLCGGGWLTACAAPTGHPCSLAACSAYSAAAHSVAPCCMFLRLNTEICLAQLLRLLARPDCCDIVCLGSEEMLLSSVMSLWLTFCSAADKGTWGGLGTVCVHSSVHSSSPPQGVDSQHTTSTCKSIVTASHCCCAPEAAVLP
jgi:hypothetical protein